MTKKSRQKFKYLENKKSFYGEIKVFFIIFKELSVAKNCFRRESASLILEKPGFFIAKGRERISPLPSLNSCSDIMKLGTLAHQLVLHYLKSIQGCHMTLFYQCHQFMRS